MSTKIKIKPSIPMRTWTLFGVFDDDCWGCKRRKACRNCVRARRLVEAEARKEIKTQRKVIRDIREFE